MVVIEGKREAGLGGLKRVALPETTPETTLEMTLNGVPYRWEAYPEEVTGLRLIGLRDLQTGIWMGVTNANHRRRVAAHRAWASARHSRAPGSPPEIMAEMGERGVDPDQKVDETFSGYGHASVGDLAIIDVQFHDVPGHVPLAHFNCNAVDAGQEKSTRFQAEFSEKPLHPATPMLSAEQKTWLGERGLAEIEKRYQALGRQALDAFLAMRGDVAVAYERFFAGGSFGTLSARQRKAFESRVLDTARYFLLLGQTTGFSDTMSARNWARQIARLKAMGPLHQAMGTQLELLLAPPKIALGNGIVLNDGANAIELLLGYKAEAPSLIRHTEADTTVRDTISQLWKYVAENTSFLDVVRRNTPVGKAFPGKAFPQSAQLIQGYSAAERMVAEYLTVMDAAIDPFSALAEVRGLPDDQKREISAIVFGNHSRLHEMPQLAATTDMGFVLDMDLGALRDFNRHRAWARHIQGLPHLYGLPFTDDAVMQLLGNGFVLPRYLELDTFAPERQRFLDLADAYFTEVNRFREFAVRELGDGHDHGLDLLLGLFPMMTHASFWMHADPKQLRYLTDLRSRPGGHINYRTLAFEMAEKAAASDPLLSGLHLPGLAPDPASPEQFFDRS